MNNLIKFSLYYTEEIPNHITYYTILCDAAKDDNYTQISCQFFDDCVECVHIQILSLAVAITDAD